ncbi:MAG: two-component regulator propeller domain-containing protein, partial [Lysobacterales bacterium]
MKRWQRGATILVLALSWFACAGPVAALDPDKRITQYVRDSWSVGDGLPAYSVTAIAQSQAGYLWVSTPQGLARFDGVRFAVFDRRTSPELAKDISVIASDSAENLWIGTLGGGLVRLRDGRFVSITERQGLAGDRVVALTVASDGDVWVGGYGGVSQIRNGRVLRTLGAKDGLAGDPVTSILLQADGQHLIATLGGLYRLQRGRVVPHPTDPARGNASGKTQPPPSESSQGGAFAAIRDLYRMRDNSVMARTIEGALARVTPDGFAPWSVPGLPQAATIRGLLEDRDGNLWIGTDQHGLFRSHEGRTESFTVKDGLPEGRVRNLFEDRAGDLWVGSPEGGLYRFRDGSFSTWGRPEAFGSNVVYPVLEDARGVVWVGTLGGLVRMEGTAVRNLTTADGLPDNEIGALHESSARSGLWVGTWNAGLFRLENDRVAASLTSRDGLPSNRVHAVLEDRRGDLWIGTTGGGLARYANGEMRVYAQAQGLAGDFVATLLEDRTGALWVGTDHGISLLRDGSIVPVPGVAAITVDVGVLYEDDRGVLWIGTVGQGLYRWQNGRLTSYAGVPGFPDDTIYWMLEDAQQRFWFSSNRGIYTVDRAQLDEIASGRRSRIVATRYGLSDGLRSLEGNSGSQPAGWRGRDGRLWFPTMAGVSVVDPSRLGDRAKPPAVTIESLLADDRRMPLGASHQLPAGTRRIDIRYTAPTLTAPERTRFRVALDGFDEEWNDVGPRRVAHFTNLEPGAYRFRVTAGDDIGFAGARETTLGFSILPRYYQTWWFHLLVALTTIAAMWTLYYLRMTWLKSQNAVLRERHRMAGEIHDNLAQSLSGIFYQTEAARRRIGHDPDAAARHLEAASELAAHGAEAARRSVWELGDVNEDHVDLLESIAATTRELTQGRELASQVRSSGEIWWMPRRVRHQLLRIAQAAVANAVEHAACREIAVRLDYS